MCLVDFIQRGNVCVCVCQINDQLFCDLEGHVPVLVQRVTVVIYQLSV